MNPEFIATELLSLISETRERVSYVQEMGVVGIKCRRRRNRSRGPCGRISPLRWHLHRRWAHFLLLTQRCSSKLKNPVCSSPKFKLCRKWACSEISGRQRKCLVSQLRVSNRSGPISEIALAAHYIKGAGTSFTRKAIGGRV